MDGVLAMIPVVWLNYHEADGIATRGYFDFGMLEAVTDETLWRVPGSPGYEHRESLEGLDGGVVVLPARHHKGDIDRLNADLSRLRWCVLILAGDEGHEFPWRRVKHRNMQMWVMSPRPEHYGTARYIGSGWPGWFPGLLPAEQVERDVPFSFAGQVTHARRKEAWEAMEYARSVYPDAVMVGTESFTAGLPQEEYAALLARTMVVPCPSGPLSPDSFRAFEALEAGCIPILDLRTPLDVERGYWHKVLGEHPCPQIDQWPELLAIVHRQTEGWPGTSNRVFGWWQGYKRRLAHNLRSDVIRMSEDGTGPETPSDLITVVVPTSPIPSHPSTEVIDATIASVRAQLPDAEILVMADGVRLEQEDRRADYDAYLHSLLWWTNRAHNVAPFLAERFSHQGELMRRALDEITTPLVMFVEHDTPITGEIDWEGICSVIRSGQLNVVRLHHEVSILKPHEHLMLDRSPIDMGVPIIRTAQWSQRPHIASTAFYRNLIREWFAPSARTMIEDAVYGPLTMAWSDRGVKGWEEWKVGIYAPEGNMQRSLHLDGRGDDPKYEMHIVRP